MLKLAIALLVLLAAAFLIAPRLHQFAYWTAPLSEAEWQALGQPPWTATALPTPDGPRLAGLVRQPTAPDAPWILFLPGNSRSLLAGFQAAMNALCHEWDAGVAFWAWRGFDASAGTPDPQALRADARAAWDYLTGTLGIPPGRIHLVSYSLGTAPACALLAELIAEGTPPASAVWTSPYTEISLMGPGLWDRFRASHRFDALEFARPGPVPVLITHGAVDDTLPLEGARALARAYGEDVPVEVIPGAGHSDWLGDAAAWNPVRSWIQRHRAR